jgi:hypothetical protein
VKDPSAGALDQSEICGQKHQDTSLFSRWIYSYKTTHHHRVFRVTTVLTLKFYTSMFARTAAKTVLRRAQRPLAGSSLRAFSAGGDRIMYEVIPKDDFGEFSEYSVIFTNRALNLMSDPFQRVMRDLNNLLKETYNADKVAIIPG